MVRGFGEDEAVKGGRGQNLLPWPNRLRDGRWAWAGRELQLDVAAPDEPRGPVLTERLEILGAPVVELEL